VEFTNNEADTLGGGMANVGVSNPSLTHVVFNQNRTAYLGGGMYNEFSSPLLVRTEFKDNEAENGGGMYNYSSSPKLFNLKFKDNRAGQQGGGLYNTGSSSLLILTNVIFTGNSGGSSGGLFNFGIESLLTNVNFTGNVATEEGAGAIGNYITSSITMINCIVWDNIAKNGSSNEILNYGNMDLRHCIFKNDEGDIQDVRQGFKSDSNSISVDPFFVDPENGDLRLQEGSPAINAGDPDTDLSLFLADNSDNPIDLDGNPRVLEGRIDIGPYEFDIITSIHSKRLTAIHETGLYQNYPNPFSQRTNIKFRIPDTGMAMLKVYDLLGNEVATLVNEEKLAGDYEVHFEASGLRSGVYIFSLATEYDVVQTKRMILIH
jgi:hypothetical protein